MGNHCRALARIGDIARDVPAHDGAAASGHLFIAAGVIGMHVRVHHIPDGAIGKFMDRR